MAKGDKILRANLAYTSAKHDNEAEILCGGLPIADSQIDENDRKQQKLVHNNISCRQRGEFFIAPS
jgi:hypothetical protein